MQKTVRRVKALVMSRIADLERDLRLECAPYLVSSSSSSSALSSSAGNATREGAAAEPAFELELVAYAPPPSGAAPADEADEARKLVALLRESEVVVADPALVAPHLHHLATTHAGDLRWMQSTWAGVDSLFRALGHEQPHKPVRHTTRTRTRTTARNTHVRTRTQD
jgi:pyruvate/2-oxoglutarate dehydrogenase complex dihydrolipoamide acyltransferase (E2) component